jgi:hypothetical protein
MANLALLGNVLMTGVGAAGDIIDGKSVVGSIAKAGADMLVQDAVMGLMGGPASWALMGADFVKMGADMALANGRQTTSKLKKTVGGFGTMGNGSFADNNYSATMRQRAMQEIGGAQGANRNILGSEARRRSAYINY